MADILDIAVDAHSPRRASTYRRLMASVSSDLDVIPRSRRGGIVEYKIVGSAIINAVVREDVARDICPTCAAMIDDAGGVLAGLRRAVWPSR